MFAGPVEWGEYGRNFQTSEEASPAERDVPCIARWRKTRNSQAKQFETLPLVLGCGSEEKEPCLMSLNEPISHTEAPEVAYRLDAVSTSIQPPNIAPVSVPPSSKQFTMANSRQSA